MSPTDIIKATQNSLNIYSFTAETLDRFIEAINNEKRKEWISLTEDEIHEIYDRVARQEPYSMAVTRRSIGRAIEAKLREKNT
jgi:thiamine pyrophosphate-dependent acetolactate synthase large subunit-like protein